MGSKLLTIEQLEQYCTDNSIEFSNVDLQMFISDYELTLDNLDDFNIGLLISEYRTVESYSFLFEEEYDTRDSELDEDIRYIAFYENKNTSVRSFFVNVKDKYLVSSSDKYVFESVLDFEKKELSDEEIVEIIDNLNSSAVFEWKSFESSNTVDDGCSIKIIIVYEDDKSFEVSCTGVFSEFELNNYNEFLDSIF